MAGDEPSSYLARWIVPSTDAGHRLGDGSIASLEVGPNPFQGRTRLAYRITQESPALLAVFDGTGRRVRTLVDGRVGPGVYEVDWMGVDQRDRPLSSGVYFARLDIHQGAITKKVILNR